MTQRIKLFLKSGHVLTFHVKGFSTVSNTNGEVLGLVIDYADEEPRRLYNIELNQIAAITSEDQP